MTKIYCCFCHNIRRFKQVLQFFFMLCLITYNVNLSGVGGRMQPSFLRVFILHDVLHAGLRTRKYRQRRKIYSSIQEHPASLRMISGKNFTRDVVLVNYQKTLKEEYYYQLSWSLNNPASSRFRFPLLTPVRSTQEHHSRTAAGNRD